MIFFKIYFSINYSWRTLLILYQMYSIVIRHLDNLGSDHLHKSIWHNCMIFICFFLLIQYILGFLACRGDEQELVSEPKLCLRRWRWLRVGCIRRKVPGREILLQHFPLSWSLYGHVEKILPRLLSLQPQYRSGHWLKCWQRAETKVTYQVSGKAYLWASFSCLGSWLFGSSVKP